MFSANKVRHITLNMQAREATHNLLQLVYFYIDKSTVRHQRFKQVLQILQLHNSTWLQLF